MNLHRMLDRLAEWWRYPQPSRQQKQLLGQYTDVVDTEFTAIRLASEESARYALEHMRVVPNFATDYDLHEWVTRTQLDPDLLAHGLVMEFGVATGRTLNQFAHWLPHKTIYGFDGFDGLPEDWTSRMRRGFFARKKLPRVKKNCELIVGWFNETVPGFVARHTEPVALLHIDCDLYSSTRTVLELLNPRIVPGTVIVFDEMYPWADVEDYNLWAEGEFKAVGEWLTKHDRAFRTLLRSGHQQCSIIVTR